VSSGSAQQDGWLSNGQHWVAAIVHPRLPLDGCTKELSWPEQAIVELPSDQFAIAAC
jgi:hypothetical protein